MSGTEPTGVDGVKVSRGEIMAKLEPKLAEAKNRRQKTIAAARVLFMDFSIYPSVHVVRSFTETGSSNDIQGDLRVFWAEAQAELKARLEAPSLPSDLVGMFGQALERLWLHAAAKADESYEETRRDAEAKVAAAQVSVQEAKDAVQWGEAQLQEVKQELRNEREQRQSAEGDVRVRESQIEQLGLTIEALRGDLDRERASAEVAKKAAVEEAESSRRERGKLIENHEKEIQAADGARVFALGQIEAVRRDLETAREIASQERKIRLEESGHYRSKMFAAEEALEEARKRIASLESEVVTSKDALKKAMDSMEELESNQAESEKEKKSASVKKKHSHRASFGAGKRWR